MVVAYRKRRRLGIWRSQLDNAIVNPPSGHSTWSSQNNASPPGGNYYPPTPNSPPPSGPFSHQGNHHAPFPGSLPSNTGYEYRSEGSYFSPPSSYPTGHPPTPPYGGYLPSRR
ncbi:hypothetical protein D9757_006581 [Collybiopsis confluens]|uniref:Uncharacterized protein n=1 Tax=Collybiopsis confluens TaxID=2823264 RepID=A0A8H5MAQ3_9AGAR|nr:hypothetical protein D9757_006581 [Collybiopsis confluens]